MTTPAASAAVRASDESQVAPAMVRDLELSRPVPHLPPRDADGIRCHEAWLLVRVFDEPVGLATVPLGPDGATPEQAMQAVRSACGDAVAARVTAAGGDAALALDGRGAAASSVPRFLADHEVWARHGQEVTVAVCTRDRAHELERALDSLAAQSYRLFRVLVVDNAPSDDTTRRLVAARDCSERVAYVCERRPGLSWARNRALAHLDTPLVAWLDDDEVADQHWLMELVAAFCTDPGAAAVSGTVVPGELRTRPQLWFEQYGGHSKGRGFTPQTFRLGELGGQSPLYPLPPFGVGANMAFRTDALRWAGGFDPALGAGTATCGGEDTLVFSRLLLAGETVVYRPTALTRHYHRRDYGALRRQMRGYGVGLTAYYTSLLCGDPQLAVPLLRLLPRAVHDTLGRRGEGAGDLPQEFPRELLAVKTRAMVCGPFAYARARRVARRLRSQP